MRHDTLSIRSFIGAKDFQISRSFYTSLGFEETVITHDMSYFRITDQIGFYLQDAYVHKWVDNTMLFVEVKQVESQRADLLELKLADKYPGVRISEIVYREWGCEYFVNDPSGILWHFGNFNQPSSEQS